MSSHLGDQRDVLKALRDVDRPGSACIGADRRGATEIAHRPCPRYRAVGWRVGWKAMRRARAASCCCWRSLPERVSARIGFADAEWLAVVGPRSAGWGRSHQPTDVMKQEG